MWKGTNANLKPTPTIIIPNPAIIIGDKKSIAFMAEPIPLNSIVPVPP